MPTQDKIAAYEEARLAAVQAHDATTLAAREAYEATIAEAVATYDAAITAAVEARDGVPEPVADPQPPLVFHEPIVAPADPSQTIGTNDPASPNTNPEALTTEPNGNTLQS